MNDVVSFEPWDKMKKARKSMSRAPPICTVRACLPLYLQLQLPAAFVVLMFHGIYIYLTRPLSYSETNKLC